MLRLSGGLRLWLVPLLGLALVAAACGGDDDGDSGATTQAPAATEAPAVTEAAPEGTEAVPVATEAAPEPAPAPEPTEPPEPTTIRLVPWGGMFIDFIDLYVGEENGYFAEANVIVEQLAGAGAGDAVRQLVAGNADIAMADAYSGFFAVQAGAEIEGFYCPYTQNWLTLLVNTAAGINEPADLRGKTIAVTSQASTSKWYASLLLAANGITEDEVTYAATGVNFGPALLSGEAQAASTWGSVNWALFEAGGFPADVAGDYEIWQYEQVPGPNDVYFAHSSWLDENADAVAGFIGALQKAKAWIEENPDAAAEIGSRYAVGAENMDRNRAVIDYRIEMQNTGPGVAENGKGWCDVPTIQDLADKGVELGILEERVDAASVISNNYVDRS